MIRESQSLANELIEKSELPPARAWETYWLPVLSAYSQQSVNGCREIRQTALANLQRTLIANEVLSNADIDLTMVFERLIFPMLDELLKPQVFRRDPEGMGETRLRASALLCKIFLHYLVQLSEKQGIAGMTELWLKILGYLDRFMHSGRRDQMVSHLKHLSQQSLTLFSTTTVRSCSRVTQKCASCDACLRFPGPATSSTIRRPKRAMGCHIRPSRHFPAITPTGCFPHSRLTACKSACPAASTGSVTFSLTISPTCC